MAKILTSHRLALILIIETAFITLSYISQDVFCNYPFSMDEYAYLYQGKIFATGHLVLPINALLQGLIEIRMVISHGVTFSQYPPGFPFLLSLGVKLGLPGLINPAISTGTLILIYMMGAELIGSLYSLLILLLLITNSYFLSYGASYFSQPAALFFSSLALFFYLGYKKTGKTTAICASALAFGFATLVRPLDAFCLWIVLFIDLILAHKEIKPVLLFCILSSLGTILLLFYNNMLTAHWCLAPLDLFSGDFKLFYLKGPTVTAGAQITAFLTKYLIHIKKYLWPVLVKDYLPHLIFWTPFILLNFLDRYKGSPNFKKFMPRLLTYCLIFILLYNVASGKGWNQYGPRFWYPLFLPLSLLAMAGIKKLYTVTPRQFFWAIFGVFILGQVFQSIDDLYQYSGRFKFIQQLRSDINKNCPDKSIIVLNNPKVHLTKDYFINWADLRRNPFLNGPRLYLVRGNNLKPLQKFYPDYSVCNYYFKNSQGKPLGKSPPITPPQ